MKFESSIQIENKTISEHDTVFIIAEAGVNHNGDMKTAKKLIDAAVEADADAVKFQTFKTEKLILRDMEKAPYQKKTSGGGESQYDMLKRLELTKEETRELMEYAKQKGIIFLSTPFEETSLNELDEMGLPAFKIAATDLTNIRFLRQVARKGKPMILSAGMCYMEEVKRALTAIEPINGRLILLQCTADYPIKDEEANIKVVETFRNEFDILTGYSDHSVGVGAAPYAVVLGAKVIEKHFTLDRNGAGPDHRASVTPEELKRLVGEIRKAEKYMGNGEKMPTVSERMTRKSLQKCLVAAKPIAAGEVFGEENITAKRTGGEGISALYFDEIAGKKADRDYKADEIIRWE